MSVAGWPAIKVTTAVRVAASTWMKVFGSGAVPGPVPARGPHEDTPNRKSVTSRRKAPNPPPRLVRSWKGIDTIKQHALSIQWVASFTFHAGRHNRVQTN